MKLKEGFILRQLAGQNVVIPSGAGMDLNLMITLNDAGKLLWEMLDKGAEEADLVAGLLKEYNVDEETAAKHVAQFVRKMRDNGFLE